MKRFSVRAGTVLVAAALLFAVGCAREEQPALEPTVAPPAVAKAGVLRAGVDLKTPPFAGEEAGKQAGLDIDVAAALAERLGLSVEYVAVAPLDAAAALSQGTVDVVLSVPPSDASLSAVSLAGSYAYDGPAFFVATDSTASIEPTLTLESRLRFPIGVQKGSESAWLLDSEYGSDALKGYDTLREAFTALDAGEVSLIAGDAFVGAYIARDFPNVHFAGQIVPAHPLAVAVAVENTQLNDAVQSALDALAVDGLFETLRTKWVGDLPALESGASTEETPTP